MADDVAYGQMQPQASYSETDTIMFICRQIVARLNTTKLVKVTKVTGGGEGEPAGTVEVQPLVSQIDGNGYGTAHGIVPNIPWSRVQGGTNAIICDPEVDDIGYVVVSDRDISTVKNTRAAALPGSRRQYNLADGIYAGGCLNIAPDQYLVFTATGVRLVDKNGNSLALAPTGFSLADQAGNSIVSTSVGMTMTISGGNKIIMAAGFVNIIAPVLQVNGVPVTVP